MERKLLATLKVYTAENGIDGASTTRPPQNGGTDWTIVLMDSETREDLGTVLAHELGHFVGGVAKQNLTGDAMFGKNNVEKVVNEALANTYATTMYPQADQAKLKEWFKTYTDFLAEARKRGVETIPTGFLEAIGVVHS